MFGLFRLLMRVFFARKNPFIQLLISLIYLGVGVFFLYGLAIGAANNHSVTAFYVGIVCTALGLFTFLWAMSILLERGWKLLFARPEAVQPKVVKYVPPKKHSDVVQAQSNRSRQVSQNRARQTQKSRSRK